MDRNKQKELFSRAYVHAVASVAGFASATPQPDDDSVDLTLRADGDFHPSSPTLDLQLKCTGQDILGCDGQLHLELKLKNYNDLTRPTISPRLLVVLLVPDDFDVWLAQSEKELVIRRCAYFVCLTGQPKRENTSTVTVTIPCDQVFSVEAVVDLMREAGRRLQQ